jgi:hypothetical protein
MGMARTKSRRIKSQGDLASDKRRVTNFYNEFRRVLQCHRSRIKAEHHIGAEWFDA